MRINGTPLSPNQPNLLVDGTIRDVERMETEAGPYLYPEMGTSGGEAFDPGAALEETGF